MIEIGSAQIYHGDTLEILRGMPENSVHCCVTSPPYYTLRNYGVPGMIGLEDTFQEYLDQLFEIFEQLKRVLRSDGTLWLNIGDSWAQAAGKDHQATG